MNNNIKEKKVIKLFENYFNNIENEYDISYENIQNLKNRVKKDIKEIIEK